MMNIIGSGFKAVEEQVVRLSVSEKYILDKINKTFPHYQLETPGKLTCNKPGVFKCWLEF